LAAAPESCGALRLPSVRYRTQRQLSTLHGGAVPPDDRWPCVRKTTRFQTKRPALVGTNRVLACLTCNWQWVAAKRAAPSALGRRLSFLRAPCREEAASVHTLRSRLRVARACRPQGIRLRHRKLAIARNPVVTESLRPAPLAIRKRRPDVPRGSFWSPSSKSCRDLRAEEISPYWPKA
jgi:hypothetical protein